jgi:hypothetical protein
MKRNRTTPLPAESPRLKTSAESLIESKQDSLALRTEARYFLIRGAGAFLAHRKYLLASIAQRLQGRPQKILVGNESHAVLSG